MFWLSITISVSSEVINIRRYIINPKNVLHFNAPHFIKHVQMIMFTESSNLYKTFLITLNLCIGINTGADPGGHAV